MAMGQIHVEDSEDTSSKFGQSTRILGRKRVVVTRKLDSSILHSPMQKRRSIRRHMERLNRLELLPEDILVRVLCKVNHSDLKQLLLVSKSVNQATLIARELHFAFSTPLAKRVFKTKNEAGEEDDEFGDSEEAPNAPKQQRFSKSRIDGKRLASITVALFASPDD
ncbi:F-box protein At1g61340-like [Typha angustifolia]|uniref:F-box protein At1g61340-like n=1 Tax=Typha angustifolia TaxID=59011 RepID=UPI003C2FE444